MDLWCTSATVFTTVFSDEITTMVGFYTSPSSKMAGQMNLTANGWILEYVLDQVWGEFKKDKSVPSYYIDMISGLCSFCLLTEEMFAVRRVRFG